MSVTTKNQGLLDTRAQSRHWTKLGDVLFRQLCRASALFILAIAALLIVVLTWQASISIVTNGLSFFTTAIWDPEPSHREFGALAFIYGTVVTSAIAMLVAIPLGVGTAAFLSEIAPARLRRIGSFLVEMLAAIPSVVFGFWGLYVFVPALQSVMTALGGPTGGTGILPAGLVLGIMIVPYVAAVSYDVIRAVPQSQRAGALAVGATRWQTIWTVVLPFARPGIIGGCFLALGRALGETMAVTMLIGNRPEIAFSLFAKGNSIPSVIANEFTEAAYDLYRSSLVELGLVLLLVSIGFSVAGRLLIWRMTRPTGKPGVLSRLFRKPSGSEPSPTSDGIVSLNPSAALLRTTRRSTQWVNRLMTGGSPRQVRVGLLLLTSYAAIAATSVLLVSDRNQLLMVYGTLTALALVTVLVTLGMLGIFLTATIVPLFLILGYLLYRGAGSLDVNLFTKMPAPVGQSGGGLVNAFYGSFLMVGLATLTSVPIGVLAAIYLTEFRSERLGPIVRFVGELLGSVPSIVIGIFGYFAIVEPITEKLSGLAGGFALGIMMIPIVLRATEEALKLVPKSLREASLALGGSHAQTVLRVTVPACLSAIVTAVFLGIARVAGETAPLLLTAGGNTFWPNSLNDNTPSLPVFIFNYAISPYEDWHRQAWAAAFVLVMFIMVLNVAVRVTTGSRAGSASRVE